MITRSLKHILFGVDEKTASKSPINTTDLGGDTYQKEPNKRRLMYRIAKAATGNALAYGSIYTLITLRPEIQSSGNGALIELLISSGVVLGAMLSTYNMIKMAYDKEDEEHDRKINQMYNSISNMYKK